MGMVSIGHFPGECPGVACSLVEHWLFSLVIWPCLLVRLFGDRTWPRGVAGLGTLLGPEGAGAFPGLPLLWTGPAFRHTAPVMHAGVSQLVCVPGFVAVWVPGPIVF
jgi:hypothetical protein